MPDGSQVRSTRNLIRVMGWAGTALVARLGRQIVPRKKDCHILYRKHVGDEWSAFLESIYQKCREEWQCLIPQDPGQQAELKALCQRALEFENHFLILYRHFLLSELHHADHPAKMHALWVMQKIPYIDPEIVRTVQTLAATDDATGQSARQVLRSIDVQTGSESNSPP